MWRYFSGKVAPLFAESGRTFFKKRRRFFRHAKIEKLLSLAVLTEKNYVFDKKRGANVW
jgi:hypothetical protein